MLTVQGELAVREGLMVHYDRWGKASRSYLPPIGYLRQQTKCDLLLRHDAENWTIGEVVHLERPDPSVLMCVARIHPQPRLGDPGPPRNCYNMARTWPADYPTDEVVADQLSWGDWFFSCEADAHHVGDGHLERARIKALSLVQNPAGIGLAPIRWTRTDVAAGHSPPGDWSWPWKDCWKRAYERAMSFEYKYSDRRPILDLGELNWLDEIITGGDNAHLDAVAAGSRAEAAQRLSPPPTPQPATKTPTRPRVRVDGRELDERLSRQVLDWLESDVDLSVIRRRVAALMG